jgi:leucyl-tRNA synthetase
VGEPFAGLFTQGMVTHETYRSLDGRWLSPDEVEVGAGGIVETATGTAVETGRIEKMSKSKKNVVDSDVIVEQYGADAARWFLLSDSPPERDLEWSEGGIEGAWRFVNRLWRIATAERVAEGQDRALDRKLHQTIVAVTANIESLAFNKAIANLYELTSAIEKAAPSASRTEAAEVMLRLARPMAPHVAEEAWAALGKGGLIADAPWPEADPALLVNDEVTIAVQVNGKLRDTLTAAKGLPRETVEEMALASEKIVRALDGKPPRKVIVVPDRLVNIVA